MYLPSLATVDDVQSRLFRELTEPELLRIDVLLADASAVVRRYTRRDFTIVRATQRMRPVGWRIRLPRRPVVDVHTVTLIIDGHPVPVTGYVWDGLDEVWLTSGQQVINLAESAMEWLAINTPVAEVDYTSGDAEVPLDVVSVICSMISRSLSTPGGGGIISEAVGEYTYRLSDAAAQGPLTLTPSERSVLSAYRAAGSVVELRM